MMDKSVLASISPLGCELIANGKRTIMVQKTKPKIPTPFTCYIYCTKGEYLWKDKDRVFLDCRYNRIIDDLPEWLLNGKVIGEYICNDVSYYYCYDSTYGLYCPCNEKGFLKSNAVMPLNKMCLNQSQLIDYGKEKPLYSWHISNLKVYDKPKELNEFYKFCDKQYKICCPPKLWCYVYNS